ITRQTVREWPLTLGPYKGLTEISFSADGTKLLTGTCPVPVVWSVPEGKQLFAMRNPLEDRMAMTLDFRTAAIAGVYGDDSSVLLLDTVTGKELRTIKTQGEYIDALAFSPDNKTLATSTGSTNKLIHLWDVTTGSSLGSLEGHNCPPQKLIFFPDGKTLASGSADQTIRLWNLTTRQVVRTLRGHEHWLSDLALLPDGKTLVSSAYDGTIRLWDTSVKEASRVYSCINTPVMRWQFSQDSRSIVTLDWMGKVRLFHSRGFSESEDLINVGPPEHPAPWHASLASDRPLLAIIKPNDVVQIWNWETKEIQRQLVASTEVEKLFATVAFVDHGNKLLLNWVSEDNRRHGFSEWDLVTGKPIRSWPYAGPSSFPSGRYVPGSVTSADGRWSLVCWNGDHWSGRSNEIGPVALINLVTGNRHELPKAGLRWWDGGSFSADGRLLAVPSSLTTTVWDLSTAQLVKTINNGGSTAFSPDGQRLAVGQGLLFNTTSWEHVLRLDIPSAAIVAVKFSPDGNTVAAHTQFGKLHIWRAPSWAEIEAQEMQISNPP
ncbi:MAG: WD40 repeat domain-containing protein, partial [Opitutae bacterium]